MEIFVIFVITNVSDMADDYDMEYGYGNNSVVSYEVPPSVLEEVRLFFLLFIIIIFYFTYFISYNISYDNV